MPMPLVAERDHPGTGADRSFVHRPGGSDLESPRHVGCLDVHHSCLGKIAVVALGHDRNDDAFDLDRRIGRNRCRDGAVVDTSHGVRRREVDGRADRPPPRAR